VKAVRDRLLGVDDFVLTRADHKRRAVRRNDLHFQWHARHGSEGSRNLGAVRLRHLAASASPLMTSRYAERCCWRNRDGEVEELVWRRRSVDEYPPVLPLFADREYGPDRPGLNAAVRKAGPASGGDR